MTTHYYTEGPEMTEAQMKIVAKFAAEKLAKQAKHVEMLKRSLELAEHDLEDTVDEVVFLAEAGYELPCFNCGGSFAGDEGTGSFISRHGFIPPCCE